MSRPTVPATILANRGVDIPLIDGPRRLCYTFRGIMALEEEFGHVNTALSLLERGGNDFVTTLCKTLCAGLIHEVTVDGAPLGDVENLAPLLDTMLLDTYTAAIDHAIAAAFPEAKPDEKSADASDPTQPSPGPSGITSPPSPSAEPTASSGG